MYSCFSAKSDHVRFIAWLAIIEITCIITIWNIGHRSFRTGAGDRPRTSKIIHLGWSNSTKLSLLQQAPSRTKESHVTATTFLKSDLKLYLGGDKSVICEILRSDPEINKSLR